MTQFKVLSNGVTTDVQITILHAKVIATIADIFDSEGRCLAAVEQFELTDFQLDVSRRHIWILRFTFDNDTFSLNHVFTAESTGLFDKFRIAVAIQEKLGDAITVAEVNPNEGAFVAHTLHPAS